MERIPQKMDDSCEFNYKIINCKAKYIRAEKMFKLFLFVLLNFFYFATQKLCRVNAMRYNVTKTGAARRAKSRMGISLKIKESRGLK